MSETSIKRAAIYLRISQDRHMTGDAIRRQQDDNLYTCSYNGWEVVATYTDQSRSAFSGAERPEFDRMVRDFRAGKFDVIVAWKLDRLVRRVGTLTDMVREVQGERPEDGLRICTGDCGLLDLTRPDGRYLATLFANNAELESARKGERERRANLQHALEGNPRRASQRCYGYTREREVVEDEAALVRACYKAYTSGHAMNAILRALNGDETSVAYPALKTALTGLKEPQTWTRTRLKYMLINPKYAGFVAYVSEPASPDAKRKQRARIVADHVLRDENGAPVRGNWEPIIDEATWFKAAELAKARSKGEQPNWRKHVGSGIYRCGVCGKPLYVCDGSYRCSERGHVCRLRKPIDDLVIATVRERLGRGDLKSLLPRDEDGRLEAIEHELGEVEARLVRYQTDYRAGNIDGALFKTWSDEEVARRDALLAEREALTSDPTGGLLTCNDPVAAFDAFADDPVRVGRVIDCLMTVTIQPFHRGQKRGKRTFNYEGIEITWR